MVKRQTNRTAQPPTHPSIERARKLANLMDSAVTIPLINKKIGLDPVLGLIPGGGDAVAALIALYPVWVAHQLGLSNEHKVRMGVNVLADFVIGTLPVVGDIADIFWKSNRQNLDILEKAYLEHRAMRAADMQNGAVVDVSAEPV